MILPEWAVIAQKAGNKDATMHIESRMKLIRMYPTEMSPKKVAELRI